MADRVAQTILKYTVDQASVANVRRSIENLKREQQELKTSVETLGPATTRASGTLSSRFKTARSDIRGAINDIEQLRREMERVNTEAAKSPDIGVDVSATQAARRAQGQALTAIGTQIRDLPAMPIPGAGFSTDMVGKVLRTMGNLGVSVEQLGIAGGVALPVVGFLALGLSDLSKRMEESGRATRALIATQQDYHRAVITSTRETLEAEIEARRIEVEIARATFEELNRVTEEGYARAREALGAFDQLAGGIIEVLNPGGARDLRQARDEAAEALRNEEFLLGRLEAALQNNITATNDAKEAERRLAEARAQTAIANAEIARQNAVQDREFARLSAEQIEQRIRQFEAESEGLRKGMDALIQPFGANLDLISRAVDQFISEGQDVETALRNALTAASVPDDVITQFLAYREQLRDSVDDQRRLTDSFLPLARAREREIEAVKETISAIDRQIAAEREAFELLSSGTVEGIDKRLDAINAEQFALSRQLPLLQELAETSDEGADRFKQAQERMAELNREMGLLATIRPDVAQRQYNEEVAKLTEALVRDTNRIEQARDARIAQINADLADKEADAAQDRERRISEARRAAQLDREKQEEDHQRNLQRIVRRANAAMANAIASRDALAFHLARQRREEERREEEENNKARLKEINDREREELRVIQQRYNDQLVAARQAAGKAIRLEQQKAQAEIDMRIAAHNAEIRLLQSALSAEYALQQQFWNASLALARRTVEQISQQRVSTPPQNVLIPNAVYIPPPTLSSGSSGGGGAGGRSFALTPYATGTDYVPRTGPALLHKGEMVIPARQAERIRQGGGMTTNINVNLDGKSIRATSAREASRIIYETLVAAGVAA